MAEGIQNYPNINPPDSDYPNGSIRDKAVAIPGTPVSRLTYDDIHQNFAKWLRLASETANGLPDNEYNGFQYMRSMFYLFEDYSRRYYISGVNAGTIIEADYNELAICKPDAYAGWAISMAPPTGSYKGVCRIANYSPNTQDLYDNPGVNTINGAAPPYSLPAYSYIELKLVAGDWVIQKYHQIEPQDF